MAMDNVGCSLLVASFRAPPSPAWGALVACNQRMAGGAWRWIGTYCRRHDEMDAFCPEGWSATRYK